MSGSERQVQEVLSGEVNFLKDEMDKCKTFGMSMVCGFGIFHLANHAQGRLSLIYDHLQDEVVVYPVT